MSWSKRQLISTAFEEIGLATYIFDLDPEQLQRALLRLEAMIAEWNALGIRIGYALAGQPTDATLDQDSGLPDAAVTAVYTNLALRLAPTIGKTPSRDTQKTARTSYNALMAKLAATKVVPRQFPSTLPLGAGHKPWLNDAPFMPEPVTPLTAGPDSELEFLP